MHASLLLLCIRPVQQKEEAIERRPLLINLCSLPGLPGHVLRGIVYECKLCSYMTTPREINSMIYKCKSIVPWRANR
jgi:hypothetical protein